MCALHGHFLIGHLIFEWYIAKLEIEMEIKITTVSMILDYVLKR